MTNNVFDFFSSMERLVELDSQIEVARNRETEASLVSELLSEVNRVHLLSSGFNIPDYDACEGIVLSSNMSEEEAVCLALNAKSIVREQLLKNARLSSDKVLMRLARDSSPSIRQQVFYRVRGFSGFVVYCFDPSVKFRSGIASLPSTESNLLRVLSCDSNEAVQFLVAKHKNTTDDVLIRLAKSGVSDAVRVRATRELSSRW